MKSLKSIFARAALPAVMLLGLSHEAKAQSPMPISGCNPITQSGSYVLTSNLQSAGADCLLVQNVANVTIDGQGHTITVLNGNYTAAGIHFKNAVGAVVQNTTFQGNSSLSVDSENSQSISVFNSRFNDAPAYADSASTYFYLASNPSMINSPIISYTSPTYINYNTIQNTDPNAVEAIVIFGGSGHFVWGNQIDGGWTGAFRSGLDDGVFLVDVSNANISNNTIAHVWDTGIETAGSLSGSWISGNNISNVGNAGIGGWWNDTETAYGASWTGNTVTQNTVSYAPQLIYVETEQATDFSNNTISYNTLSLPGMHSGKVWSGGVVGHNNTFTGNNFGEAYGPLLYHVESFVDGGGNTCIGPEPSQVLPYPLTCIPPQPPH